MAVNLRPNFVLQVDAILPLDRLDIGSYAKAGDTIGGSSEKNVHGWDLRRVCHWRHGHGAVSALPGDICQRQNRVAQKRPALFGGEDQMDEVFGYNWGMRSSMVVSCRLTGLQ